MKAFLKNHRQSPRKVELVARLIKGKRVAEAFVILKTLPKRSSIIIDKLLASAVSNAKQAGISEENLLVQNVRVDKGVVLKRTMPRARGSASRIKKRTSHITLTLIVAPIATHREGGKKSNEKIKVNKVPSAKVSADPKKSKSNKLEPKN
jgi:large subunit ribosomal protein L22